MSESSVPVLIVGGGPAGVTLAIELFRRGVHCRVIDRAEGPVGTSRSFTLHARTLELFEMAGIAETFLDRGVPAVSMDYHFDGVEEPARLDFSELDSRYPFTLNINQNVTEEVLREHLASLGGTVEWGTELVSLTADNPVVAIVRHSATGREEAVAAEWLVGCDGVLSTVRGQLDIPYEGGEYTGMQMRMMDVPLTGFPLPDDRIHYFIAKDRLLLMTKLPGDSFRVLISDQGGDAPTETARAAFQSAVDVHFHGAVRLGEPAWATVFRIWRRLTPTYSQGRVFLAGDAAHCHSPAGGQGMNACIQDAVNLGWKLALVARGLVDPKLLDTYEVERRPIAEQVIDGTNALHAIIMAHGTPIADRIALSKEPGFTRDAITKISGLAYHYRGPGEAAVTAGVEGLTAGDRAPDAAVSGGLRVHDLLRHPDHTLLLFGADNDRDHLEQVATVASSRFGDTVRPHIVTGDSPARRRYAPEGVGACLVRPDGYIRLTCTISDPEPLLSTLDGILVRTMVTPEATTA